MPDFNLKYCVKNIDQVDTFCIYNLAKIDFEFKLDISGSSGREQFELKPHFDVELKWWTDLNIPRVANHMV